MPVEGGAVRPDIAAAAKGVDKLLAFLDTIPLDIERPEMLPPDQRAQYEALAKQANDAVLAMVENFYSAGTEDEFFFSLVMVQVHQINLLAEKTLGGAKSDAKQCLELVESLEKKFEGVGVEKRRKAFEFIKDRCRFVLNWPGDPAGPAPNWSDAVRAPFWKLPEGLPTWAWIVAGVLGAAVVAALVWPAKPAPAPAGAP